MKTILHIGRHKTGTSSLQRYLSDNAASLSAQGYLYPAAGRKGIAHHKLAETFTRKNIRINHESSAAARRSILEELQREADPRHHTLIISSEVFQNCSPSIVRETFQKEGIQIVLYVREQYEYMVSAYQQKVHAQREFRDLRTFSKEFRVDYFRFISEWAKEYDRENVRIRIFSRGALLNGDVVDDFMEQVGMLQLNEKLKRGVLDQNPSIGGGLLELKRIINHASQGWDLPPKIYAIFSDLAREGGQFRLRPQLEPDEVEAYRSLHAESNLKMASEFLRLDKSPFSNTQIKNTPVEIGESLKAAIARLIQSGDAVSEWLFKVFMTSIKQHQRATKMLLSEERPKSREAAIEQISAMAELLRDTTLELKKNIYVGD